MIRLILCFVLIASITVSCQQVTTQSKISEFSNWRGPNRDGIFPEKNLLKQWPENGPEMMWSFEGLGFGHSSVAVANNKVYITGIKDTIVSEGTLYTFDTEGNLLWQKNYGPDFSLNFHGSRSTPVIVDDLIYIVSGMGAVYCLNAENGEQVWSVDFIKDLGVDSVIQFGYSESVLINIDATTGEKYWRVEQTQQNKIHANTPLWFDGKLLISSAGREATSGLVQLQLSEDGKNAEVAWRNKKLINLMGGLVRIDTCIYGSAYLKPDWQVISWNTGEMLVQNKDLGGGSIIYADGLFYCYAENDGELALVNASPEKFEIINRFKIPLGTDQHWARPVIKDGKLYIRHGNALMVYKITS